MAQPMSATAKPIAPSEPPLTPLSGMPRRIGRQLALILLGGVAVFAFQIAADMGFNDKQTSVATFALPAVITLVSLAAWGATAALAPYSDPLLVGIATLVSGFGIVLIRRISYTYSENAIEPDAGLFAGLGGRQLIYYIGGVIVFGIFLAVVRDHRVLRGYAYILLFAGIAFAALPGFLPASISEAGGSKNWIRLGPISVQPSEFAKLMLLVFFAVYLIRKRDVLQVAGNKFLGLQFPRLKDLGPIVVVWAACLGLLVLERDLGTSLLLFSIFLSMLYMATRRVSWILIGLGLFFGGCVAIYPFFSHLQLRVRIWLDPFNEQFRDGDSYQLVQGLIGMNDGGLLGTGPGQGRPDLVPAAESDFILAIVGEEVGLIGLTALLVLYAVFVERAMKTAVMSRDQFGKLVAGGLAFQVAFQLFIVCGGVTGLIPMTGQTTTFLAAGGSSLLGSWIMLALLVRVSDDARKPWQVSYGLQKTEAPPEFLAEQAAKRAAEEAEKAQAAGVGQSEGPVPGGDQPTQMIISGPAREGPTGAPTSSPPGTPMSPPPGPPTRPAPNGVPQRPQNGPPPPTGPDRKESER
ncbi:FtsW/RodA/SpoVE family cell cycle protein [Glycomyces salinus]|uniref:FtsW/RodA/SpoVE family cell cycle protein n=1 Tax=Glycomyces salinus TaxID=980294 RepID=UPI0018EBD06D|nr:FtsW/RodA/SpoVE family cell cycle protein [Glycomyces salinus]